MRPEICTYARTPSRATQGLAARNADTVFGREQSNSTGGTFTRVGTNFAGAHLPG
jgi:hypothetical protein